MSDLLNIGASGLRAYRSALATVSENVSNANSEGYSRRKIVLTESPVSAGSSMIYRPQTNFGGVDVQGIARSWDEFKSTDARKAGTEYGQAETRLRWAQTIETALDDSSAGVGSRLTAIFNAADELAADPNGDFARRSFLSSIDQAAGAFRQTSDDLAQLADHIGAEATSTTDLINADLTTLARLNVQIVKAGAGTSTYAQVSDERDRLLDEVASKIGITVRMNDNGTVKVTLAGSNSETLVEDAKASLIGVQQASDGRLSFVTSRVGGLTTFTPDGGALAGLQEISVQLSGRRAELDSIASDFTTAMNGWSAQGLDANGAAGTPLLAITTAGASSMQALITDPDLVPAANTADGAFGNLLTLDAVRTGTKIEDRWVALVANHAQGVAAAKTNSDVTGARRDIANATRDAVQGVDLDVEAADLLRYQQAYSACARIVQVARDTLQDIFNMF